VLKRARSDNWFNFGIQHFYSSQAFSPSYGIECQGPVLQNLTLLLIQNKLVYSLVYFATKAELYTKDIIQAWGHIPATLFSL
jgi:hypothetical protein